MLPTLTRSQWRAAFNAVHNREDFTDLYAAAYEQLDGAEDTDIVQAECEIETAREFADRMRRRLENQTEPPPELVTAYRTLTRQCDAAEVEW